MFKFYENECVSVYEHTDVILFKINITHCSVWVVLHINPINAKATDLKTIFLRSPWKMGVETCVTFWYLF